MNKKETVKFVPPVTEQQPVTETPIFESDAYGSPQPDAGMETTVLKPVGMGAPVPIVAPKHNTIQLQPIIVPLAVVPYMTQDSDVLRAENSTSAGGYSYNEFADTEFSKSASENGAKAKTKEKKKGVAARVCALVIFVFAAFELLAFLLAKFAPNAFGINFADLNVIDIMVSWIRDKVVPDNKEIMILYAVAAGSSVILFLTTLVSLIFGKYSHGFISVLQLLSAAPVGGALIYMLVKGTFALNEDLALVILTAISVFGFLLSVIFIFATNKRKQYSYGSKDDRRANFNSDNLI